ncbi:hypothetical protein AWH62_16085 [Maricaulis sp. W15]|nr:hypothetical protein AWH62_16085 [Maricaulis sp. W15]
MALSAHGAGPPTRQQEAGALLGREDDTPFGEARQQPAANDNGESYTPNNRNNRDRHSFRNHARFCSAGRRPWSQRPGD